MPLDSFRRGVRFTDSTVVRSPHVQNSGAFFQLFDLVTHFGVHFLKKKIRKQERRLFEVFFDNFQFFSLEQFQCKFYF